jgi:hypothetical protein
MRFPKVVLLLLVGGLAAGCASPELAIYPTQTQPSQVEETVNGGYTFLQSRKGGSVVTVSLRRATEEYVQSYVSIVNEKGDLATISPSRIMVESAETGNTFSAYRPSEAPGVVKRAAQESRSQFVGMNTLAVTGQTAIGAREGGAGTRGSYGSDSGDKLSFQDVMLQAETLPAQKAVSGLVFTPFSSDLKKFTMKVPVDGITHAFQFNVQRIE